MKRFKNQSLYMNIRKSIKITNIFYIFFNFWIAELDIIIFYGSLIDKIGNWRYLGVIQFAIVDILLKLILVKIKT